MSDALRRAIRTAVFTFVAIFALALTGVLGDLTEWANDGGNFPNLDVLAKAAVAGFAAAASGLVTWIVNALEDGTAWPAFLKYKDPNAISPPPR